ncbi:hypothetical protein B0A54_05217 [Friedmanniomyces endolithicus]|uniref:Phosphoribomutase n=1 Tax=Friedmanniomyces endolithicus TaxID=329885 RepID=A0A4U0V7W2_9PEZI|nr:hypothetical protein B0A54_05217 [Friedmanniomyces endolithicus]
MTDSLPIGKLATRWLQQDRDPDTRREIEALIAADDGTELERRLRQRIAFGTAGLRSAMKAGYAHMNSLTVLQASQGLADYILAQRQLQGTSGRPTVVIGYDARHNSQKFARLAAGAFLAKDFGVLWFGILVHTPMVPFAVSHFGAAAGVMVTASHNPPADNGYKVYWGNGCQIIPPHDKGIALAIANVELSFDARLMHVVEAQAMPDPDFPTVHFPNPEEKGALDLACQEAERNGSKIVISNDPDADRFAAAERLEDRRWHQFTGNQMGVLLASYVLETSEVSEWLSMVLASTVSSRMLKAMGRRGAFKYRETLTGFKWLGNVAQQTARESWVPIFAFEEAIGYMFPSVVWDKDGIAAAVAFLAARRMWLAEGLTPYQKLQQLYQKWGYFERRITRWRDLTLGYDTATADGRPDLPTDPDSQMITCELEDGVVFTARGSGTEPKIKLYIEATAESSAEAKRLANEVLRDLLQEWFEGLNLAGT